MALVDFRFVAADPDSAVAHAGRVVVLADERWRVSASAYALVREFLRHRGFLRDDF